MQKFVSINSLIRYLHSKQFINVKIDPEPYIDGKRDLLETLEKQNLLLKGNVLDALSSDFNLPVFTRDDIGTIDYTKTKDLRSRFGSQFFGKHLAAVICTKNSELKLLISNPFDTESSKIASFVTGLTFNTCLVRAADLRAINLQNLDTTNSFDTSEDLSFTGSLELLTQTVDQTEQELVSDFKEPVVKLINKILVNAIISGTSDIHIEPMELSLVVKYRIDGALEHFMDIPRRLQPYVTSRIKLLSGMDIAEKRRPQDGRFQIRYNSEKVDIRASALPTNFGECIVLRLLQSDSSLLNIEQLAMPTSIKERLYEALKSFGRIILVTGPTGSGKTTTLYACLNHLRKSGYNIVTVENPVEYKLAGINQVQVNEPAGFTFAAALRSILRQDPDVIFIGEIRDSETAEIAIRAAQTGHLVLSTLHTNDAPSAITRLLDLGIEPFLIASSVSLILSQRLVRKLCSCEQNGISDDKILEYQSDTVIQSLHLDWDKLKSGSQCAKCRNTGFKGRTGIYGMLKVDPSVSKAIHNGTSTDQIVKENPLSVVSLNSSAIRILESGVSTLDEVRPHLTTGSDGNSSPFRPREGADDNPTRSNKVAIIGLMSATAERLATFLKGESWIPEVSDYLVPLDQTCIYVVGGRLDNKDFSSFIKSLKFKEAKSSIIIIDPSEDNRELLNNMSGVGYRILPFGASALSVLSALEGL